MQDRDFESRVVRLETIIENINMSLQEIKTDIKDIKRNLSSDIKDIKMEMTTDFKDIQRDMTSDFRWLLTFIIGGLGSIAGLMAHGFHWF